MTNKKIVTVTLIVIIIHFTVTSVIGHYIAFQIGTQMGQIVARGLTEASKNSSSESDEEAHEVYQNMKNRSDEIIENWKISRFLISLPAKPLMNSLFSGIRKDQLSKLVSKEITKEQFRIRGKMLEYGANFVNSLSFGFIVYLILRRLKHYGEKKGDK